MLLDSNQRSRAQSREEEADADAEVFGRPKSPEIRFQRIDAMRVPALSLQRHHPTFHRMSATQEYSTRTYPIPHRICMISYRREKTLPRDACVDVSFKASGKRLVWPDQPSQVSGVHGSTRRSRTDSADGRRTPKEDAGGWASRRRLPRRQAPLPGMGRSR